MKNLRFILLFILYYSSAISQNTFFKTYGTAFFDGNVNCFSGYRNLCQLSDGNGYAFVRSGYGFGYKGSFGMCLFKTNKYGDTLFTKHFFVLDSIEKNIGQTVEQNPDGGFIIGAGFNNFLGAGLIRTDSNANVLWSVAIDKPANASGARATGVYGGRLSDNTFFISGQIQVGYFMAFISRVDANGNLLFGNRYQVTNASYGSSLIKQTIESKDGGLISVGHILYNSAYQKFLLKTDKLGNTLWARAIGSPSLGFDGNSLVELSDKSLILSGSTGYSPQHSLTVTKVDSLGNHIYTKLVSDSLFCYPSSIVKNTNDDVFVTAQTAYVIGNTLANSILLLKFNSNGNLLWKQSFKDMNVVEGIKIDNDGGVVFSGNTELGAGQGDLFLAKTDANGNLYCNSVISSQTITNILLTSSSVSMTAINDLVATPISLSSARGATLNTFCEDLAMTVKQNPSLISSLGVSPNPSSNFVVITIPQSLYTNDLTLEITSFLGQTLVKSEVNEVSSKISVSKLPNGIYNIRLKNKVGETMATSKFIKN